MEGNCKMLAIAVGKHTQAGSIMSLMESVQDKSSKKSLLKIYFLKIIECQRNNLEQK